MVSPGLKRSFVTLPGVTSGGSGFGVAVGSGVSIALAPGVSVAAACGPGAAASSSSPPPDVVRTITPTTAMTTAIERNTRRCVRDTRMESSLPGMLVRSDGLLIGQPAHAWVSGQLARAWGNEAFPPPVPREPFCLAAEQHDVGWADADLEPIAGADGRPLSFARIPRPAHVAIWRGAARRMLAQSRYAALLVSLHGTSLYERVDADSAPPEVAAAIRGYLSGERALQSELAVGHDPDEVDRGRRL